jgi:hypothetical protein
MAYGDTTTLTGKGGAEYVFSIFPRNTTFNARPGVYVMGREMGESRFAFCFVGETADLSKRPLSPDKQACFNRFGVDHIFLIEEFDAARRKQIVQDLVAAYSPSCNTP